MGEVIERGGNSILRTCPVCGKNFIPNVEWAYKKNRDYYCRYNCYRQAGGDGNGQEYKREYVSSKRG